MRSVSKDDPRHTLKSLDMYVIQRRIENWADVKPVPDGFRTSNSNPLWLTSHDLQQLIAPSMAMAKSAKIPA